MSDTPDNAAPIAGIPPGPVPTEIAVGVAHLASDNRKLVVLSMSTPQGQSHFFFEPLQMQMAIRQMQKSARTADVWNSAMSKSLILPGDIS